MAVIKTNGGYNALPISYKRGNPIPLDKSAVWYDYNSMVAYATTDPTAYVGQILSLVDETDVTSAKAYIILDLAGNVEEIGSGALSDALDSIDLELDTINTSIENIETSISNLITTVGVPASNDVEASGLFAELDKKANSADVYTKEQTDTNISTAVAQAAHLKRKEIASAEEIDVNAADADQYIYMVPSGLLEDDNKYYEYMVVEIEVVDDEGIITKTKKVERVGSWEVDLSQYAKASDLTDETSRATRVEGELLDRIEDLETQTSTLEETVSEKVDKVYYTVTDEDGTTRQVEGTLLNPEEKKKLSALSIDEDGSVGVSGTVSVDNVQGLDTWIAENAATHVQNLTENNLSKEVQDKLNYIADVNEENFSVDSGILNLKAVSTSQVSGLDNVITTVNELDETVNHETSGLKAISAKVLNLENNASTYVTIEKFNKTVGNLDALLASATTTLVERIDDLDARLTWQELDEIIN